MKMEDFFNEYRHYYINEIPHHKNGYYLYKTPPTYEENWHWAADPSNFYPRQLTYNGVRAAAFPDFEIPPKKQIPQKHKIEGLVQKVLLHGQYNRIYHREIMQVDIRTAYEYRSIFLPIDWLNFYDSTSRVRRLPHDLYGFNIISVPSYILKDKSSRESHYYEATKNFEINELIPSEIKKITVCHSINTIKNERNETRIARNKYLPYVRSPFYINSTSQEEPRSTERNYTYYFGSDHKCSTEPYVRELSFEQQEFKNIYFHSIKFDHKNIECKIGRCADPLLDHPSFKEKIRKMDRDLNLNRMKNFWAANDTSVHSTVGRTDRTLKIAAQTVQDRSTNFTHAPVQEISIRPTDKNFKFKKIMHEDNRKVCQKLQENSERQMTAGKLGLVINEKSSERSFSRKNNQADDTSPGAEVFRSEEIESSRILRNLKSDTSRYDETSEENDDDTSNLVGIQYLRKRSMSDSEVELRDTNSDVQPSVSRNQHEKHRTVKSLDGLTFNYVFSLHTNTHT